MRPVFVLGLFVSASLLFATVDWPTRILTSSGSSAAEIAQDLRGELYALPFDANRTVMDFLLANFSREATLNELLYQAARVNQRYLTDGNIEYYSQIALTGKIMALLIPETKPPRLVVPMLCPCCGQEWPRDRAVPAGVELVPKETETYEYTGIVIDCRNMNFAPSLFPRVVNELGEEIFSINFADPRYVIDGGLVLYSNSDLYNEPRIGYNPLRITAMSVAGIRPTEIKISSFDARRIHGSRKNLALLKECRVAVIFSP